MRPGENEELSIVPKRRKRTDDSLSAERAKADESLSIERQKTEKNAERAVAKSRAEADEILALSRGASDNKSDEDRPGPSRDGSDAQTRPGIRRTGDVVAGRADGEEVLRHERQIADQALETERRHVDAILDQERRQKKAAEEKVFQAERRETDRDLTQERRQTDAAAQVEKDAHVVTRAALTTRDEFLSIVSHDLRNPLGAVLMATDLLSGKLSARADPETREYVDMIGRNVSEALRLIGDLMDMDRIAQGKLGLQFASHKIGDIVLNSVKAFQPQAAAKNLSFKILPIDAAVTVSCDRDRVSQVLSNLLGNAVKFTPNGGTVTLAVERAVSGEVQVSISDTGPGIPKDKQQTIFERFWQIGKHDRRGLGLGLYISKMLVEALGGRLSVDSEVGRGSTFQFTLQAD